MSRTVTNRHPNRRDLQNRQNPKNRQWLGREGEARAARFLEERGYRIVARNVRADRVEIDLIVCAAETLVFVEVKSRRVHGDSDTDSDGHGLAAEAVDFRKQRRLRRGAHAWLAENPIEARRTLRRRFDVVTCLFDPAPEDDGPTEAPVASREAQAKTHRPKRAGWSIEHWEAAF